MTDIIRPFSTSVVQLISQNELYPNGPEDRAPKNGDEVEDEKFYPGKVTQFNTTSQKYRIKYFDGEEEDLKFEDQY